MNKQYSETWHYQFQIICTVQLITWAWFRRVTRESVNSDTLATRLSSPKFKYFHYIMPLRVYAVQFLGHSFKPTDNPNPCVATK